MSSLKNWAIAILGVACFGLYWKAQSLSDQLYTVEQASIQESIEYRMYMDATEAVLDEVCDYVDEKYEEYLPDTIWEGDVYDEYATAYQLIKIRQNDKIN